MVWAQKSDRIVGSASKDQRENFVVGCCRDIFMSVHDFLDLFEHRPFFAQGDTSKNQYRFDVPREYDSGRRHVLAKLLICIFAL